MRMGMAPLSVTRAEPLIVVRRRDCRSSGQAKRAGLLPQVVAHPRVGTSLDDVAALVPLAPAPEVGGAVLRDDGALLEACGRLVEQGHDRRDVGPRVPRAQRDEGLAAEGVERADDEVRL